MVNFSYYWVDGVFVEEGLRFGYKLKPLAS